ncbi:MAG: hypothetical protein K4H23_03500 [Mollicutes bacterium PWAP]|nr:hypothetical protein [Mollicutes bacterium PWAP]
MSIKEWDSDVEKNFYAKFDQLINIERIANSQHKESIHMFRNGVNDKSYRIDYYDKNDKLLSFYPDFIFVSDLNKEIYIMETKGRAVTGQNIDQNSNIKFKTLSNEAENIENGKYKVRIIFVETIDDGFTLFEKGKDNTTLFNLLKEINKKSLEKLTK